MVFVNGIRICYDISINNTAGWRDHTFWDSFKLIRGIKKDKLDIKEICTYSLLLLNTMEYMIYKYWSASRFQYNGPLTPYNDKIIVLVI
jgi:hypothetical protein